MRKQDIGKFDQRITLQNLTTVRNSETGSFTENWSDLRTVWANVDYQGGGSGEKGEAAQTVATQRIKFTIRKYSDLALTPKDTKIIFNNENYDVLRVFEDRDFFRNLRTILIAEQKDNQ